MSEYEKICYVCHRPESKAGPMVEATPGVCVCMSCMQKVFDMAATTSFDPAQIKQMSDMMFGYKPAGSIQKNTKDGMPAEGKEESIRVDANTTVEPTAKPEEKTVTMGSGKKDPSGDDGDKSDGEGFPGGMFGGWNIFDGLPMFEMPGRKKVKKRKPQDLPELKMSDIPAPHMIKKNLDSYVIGQERAKKAIAVAVYNHYKRMILNRERLIREEEKRRLEKEARKAANAKPENQDPDKTLVPDGAEEEIPDGPQMTGTLHTDYLDDVRLEKSNILMMGPTGSGKTYLVKTLANLLDVPLAIADATSLTESGYIGDDIESVVSKLLTAAGNDVDKAEHGIIFIDEIDKIAKKKNTTARDVSGESVQQELLKLLEGSTVEVPVGASQKNAMTPTETINTDNILFICGGAFPGLDDIIKERLKKTTSMGFNSMLKDEFDDDPDILGKVTTEDLRQFGMIPEFLGRLPVRITLQQLNVEFLVRILKEPKNAIISQYEKLLAMDEVKLEFEDDALTWIAEQALKRDTGARALRAIMEEFMLDIMYEIPKDSGIGRVVITRAYLENKGGPRIEMRG